MNQNSNNPIDLGDQNPKTLSTRIGTRNQRRKMNRRANMSAVVNTQLNNPNYAQIRGKDIDKLVALVNDKNRFNDLEQKKEFRDYMTAMNTIAKKSKTKAKLLRQAILAFDVDKLLAMPKYVNKKRSEILSTLARDADAIAVSTGLSRDQAYELIALDDFTDFLETVSSYLPVVGPYIQTAKSVYDTGSAIYNGVKNYMSNAVPMNEKTTIIGPKLNASNDRAVMKSSYLDKSLFDPNRVDVPSICAVICPQKYKVATRFDDVQPSAVLTGFWEIPVIPDPTTGAAFVVMFPGATTFTALANAFIWYSNPGSAYNPTTGSYNNFITNINSALYTSQSSLISARPVGFSTTYKSTVQNSTTYAVGQVDLYHDPASVNANYTSPSQNLSLTNIGYKPFYQRGAVTDTFSQIYYNPLDNYPYQSLNSVGGVAPIVYIFSGCNTSSVQVGTIIVHATWNVIPTPAGLSQLPVTAPGVGPATNALLDTMFTITPEVFMNDAKCNMELCKKLTAVTPTYETLLQVLVTEEYSHKQYYGGHEPGGIMVDNEISFDKL